ncbi:MAG TPA: nucleoside triphosphate pyrophosphohydrolase [Actinomycetota bacterium]|nr:nucleoside triphosphate pyrophosphohydrolase [Actinomycetota bacterium]
MARLLLVRPGAGAPDLCSLEVWQALTGRPVLCDPNDELGDRLAQEGFPVERIDLAQSIHAATEPAPAGDKPKPRLNLLGHQHGAADPRLSALAARLAGEAAARGEVAYILPADAAPVVRAVMERAMQGGLEVEVVVGRVPRGHLLLDLVKVMARLRSPGGCPWDAEQTHQTLAKHLLDEAYELLHAIEEGTSEDIAEELGDVLLQVVFHAQMGHDAQTFDIDDVADTLIKKLVNRHPHVFGDVTVEGADEVVANWDVIKEKEKGRSGVHDDIPESLPALAWAAKLQRRAGKAGFDWDDAHGPMDKVNEELRELGAAATDAEREHELGDLLLAVVALSRHLDVDAETALRRAGRRFKARVARIEEAVKAQGKTLRDLSERELIDLWNEAKRG